MSAGGRVALRLFVAAYPPPAAVGAMLDQLRAVTLPSGTKPESAETVHLTLVFLGQTRADRLGEVVESVRRAAAGLGGSRGGVIELVPDRLVTLPSGGGVPPRLVAMTARASPPLVELQRRLARRLVEPSRRDERERWLPHFTLARFPAAGPAPQAIDVPAAGVEPLAIGTIAVVQSVQRAGSDRAEHRVLASVALGE